MSAGIFPKVWPFLSFSWRVFSVKAEFMKGY